MSQLSAQSIAELCRPRRFFGLVKQTPMIDPFIPEKVVANGKSFGLSSASYDVRIAHDLELGYIGGCGPFHFALANTIESFNMPDNVVGYVCDKSSFARVFVSAFNTLFDPGFRGNATLELVNLGNRPVIMKAGDPICQFTFHWLDRKTDRPYRGKYQGQTAAPHGPRHDNGDGSWS